MLQEKLSHETLSHENLIKKLEEAQKENFSKKIWEETHIDKELEIVYKKKINELLSIKKSLLDSKNLLVLENQNLQR